MEPNKVFADGIVNGRQASPLLEAVTKVEAVVALFAGAAAGIAAGDVVVPAEVADGVVLVDVEAVVVEPLVAFDEVVLWEELSEAELSEPQPPRAARKETQTNPVHAFSAPILKTIVTCPIAA